MTDDKSKKDWNFKVEELPEGKATDKESIKKRVKSKIKNDLTFDLERKPLNQERAEQSSKKVRRVYSGADAHGSSHGFHNYDKTSLQKRLFAYLIDLFIITVCGLGIHFLISAFVPSSISHIIESVPLLELCLDALVIYFVLIRQLQTHSSTIGKRYFHLEVITTEGPYLSFGECFMREIVGKLILSALLPISILLILFQPQGRSLHDYIAATMVVDTE